MKFMIFVLCFIKIRVSAKYMTSSLESAYDYIKSDYDSDPTSSEESE